ncbi:MAG TPA: hypothetical protein QGG70_01365 [Candidatus Pacearchaeota archaeon]|jgi:ribosomal protein L44E|nr:hypothetical protein [Candidatus Pacearchaeota archaeon]|tara:strand:+ start:68 stop:388 length:321 start_codon:yes stop_codon:yes gene_type:complete
MNLPKETKRFCPYCKKRTEQKIDLVSTGFKRGELRRGSISRAKSRGSIPGHGNKGKYSRRPPKQHKRKTKTTTRKVVIYKCKECSKSKQAKQSRRVGKLLIGENKK